MKINIEIEVIPFEVPTCVYIKQKPGLRQDGIKTAYPPSIPLHELSDEMVEMLCNDFKSKIMAARKEYIAQYIRDNRPF